MVGEGKRAKGMKELKRERARQGENESRGSERKEKRGMRSRVALLIFSLSDNSRRGICVAEFIYALVLQLQ